MKKYIRFLALTLAVLLLMSALPISAFAATSWPSVSTKKFLEVIAPRKIDCFLDSSFRTRGASGRAYNSYIDPGDIVKVTEVNNTYSVVYFPTKAGEKKAVVRTADLFGVTAPVRQLVSQGKCTTYTPGGKENGYIAKGDRVFTLNEGSTVICIYQAQNSKGRGWKVGYIPANSFKRLVEGKTSGNTTPSTNSNISTTAAVQARLKAIGTGELSLNKNTVLTIGKRFQGQYSDQQCKGYARALAKLLWGSELPSTKNNNYQFASAKNYIEIGSIASLSNSSLKNLFKDAKPGYIIQVRRQHGGPHTMVLYSCSSDGIKVLEANTDGKNTICASIYSWSDLIKKNNAMSIYAPVTYKLK